MKILLSHQPVMISGGAERATLDLGAALRDLGHQVFLWGPWQSCPEFVDIAARGGMTILSWDARTQWGEMRALRRECERLKIDLVLSHGRRYNALTPIALRHMRTRHAPVLRAQVSTWDEPRNKSFAYRLFEPPWNRFWIYMLRREPCIICISHGVAADAQRALDCAPAATLVIHDAIGVCSSHTPKPHEQKSISPFRLILVGRLQPVKKFDRIVPLMQEILAFDEDVCADIAGAGECSAEIARAINAAGLPNRVRLLGHCEDMTELYENSNVLVHFCEDEGFGRIYVEAQQSGLPVVCVGGGGTAEVVKHGRTGFVHAPNDLPGMAQSILTLKHDHESYQAFSGNARQWAKTFSVSRMAEQYESVFKSIVSGSRPSRPVLTRS